MGTLYTLDGWGLVCLIVVMKKLFILLLFITGFSSSQTWGADLAKGLAAAQRGDFTTALKEWTPLAEQGNIIAQYNLGSMYKKGDGVIQDFVISHMWANIGRANGDKNSDKAIELLVLQMTPSQIEKAQDLARECVKKNYKGC